MKPDFNKIKGVIWDLDGTITDTERVYRALWLELMKDWNLPVKKEFTEAICGTSEESAMEVINKFYPELKNPVAFRTECMDRMVVYLETREIPLKKGARELIQYLDSENIVQAIGSGNVHPTINHNLTKTNLRQYFNVIVADGDVKRGKPAPDVFAKCCELMKLNPRDVLVIEDSNSGIKAGHDAGCLTMMIPDVAAPTKEIKKIVDWIYPSLLAVPCI